MTTFPSSPPSLPVSKTPNYFATTSTPGSTLTGKPLKYNQLTSKAANVTLVGSSLSDIFILHDPSDVVVWNGGVDTVEIAGSYTLPKGIDNLTLLGSANATATGNSGNNIITGNSGTDTLVTGGGNDILKGGTGPDTFVVTPQANTTTWIENFKTASDKIDLTGYGFLSFAAVKAAMVQSGTNVALNLGNGELVMIQGKQLASFTASNFRACPSIRRPRRACR
jgi:Ca2+-binding RTX toxin-like protein